MLPRAVMPVHGTGRVWRLLVVVGVLVAANDLPAGAFGDRAALKAAVDAWVADPATAEATHGSISGWDTSRVDDLSDLFECRPWSTRSACPFNDDIGAWDTAAVTIWTARSLRKGSTRASVSGTRAR